MEQSGRVEEAKTKLSTKGLTSFPAYRLEDSRLMKVYQKLQDVLVKKKQKINFSYKRNCFRINYQVLFPGIRYNFVRELYYAGFRPCRRGTFVSAKGPKTIFARARPHGGPSASVSNLMAQELAPLKQPSPKKSDSILWLRRAQRVEIQTSKKVI